MSTVQIPRSMILEFIRQELDRAYEDAEQRLSKPVYDIHGSLFTSVEIVARNGDGQKLGTYYKVGDASNVRVWRDEP